MASDCRLAWLARPLLRSDIADLFSESCFVGFGLQGCFLKEAFKRRINILGLRVALLNNKWMGEVLRPLKVA